MDETPFVDLEFAPAAVETTTDAHGHLILSSPLPLDPPPPSVGSVLCEKAETIPDRVFLAERDGDHWRTVTYGEAARTVERLAQALLDRGVDEAHPVMLLSHNSIDHALIQLAAMTVGAPAAPISPAYSLLSRDHDKLRTIFDLLTPGLVYAADGETYGPALGAIGADRVVTSSRPRPGDETVEDLAATTPTPAVDEAASAVGPDVVAKILFTSGSTGIPKGVINTHRMLCANQQAIRRLWPFLLRRPPVICDWLPWSHTFGGNHNFNMVLFCGGTLYIDEGKPAPGLFDASLRNLREVQATMYFNVPKGFAMLVPHLRADRDLRAHFFGDLDALFYAAAALPRHLWDELEELSVSVRGRRVPMLSAWGSTETAPLATSVHFPIQEPGVIGLPAPGTEIKLAPVGDKLELRVRGPNVTPGYWRREDLTAAAFDEDGFFRMGDAGRLADPDDPARGLVFDGRLAENFKLSSGTWVHAGELRVAAISACSPVIQDVVLTGHDRDEVGMLAFLDLPACRELTGGTVPDDGLPAAAPVHEVVTTGLRRHNATHPGSSRRIARALLMAEPPSIDAGEITDKGYVNQRAVLERRADLIVRLYEGTGDDVIVV